MKVPAPDGADVEALLVKGSGTDLRSITRGGFTWLSLPRLAPGVIDQMTDAEMMRFGRLHAGRGPRAERRDAAAPAAAAPGHRAPAMTSPP
ncbi:MAG: hypothetical protein IPL76_07095 [Gemmatimonadetes bacterium]|nr:hypothetical protein [Gemmatimonadota bacterium]